MRIIRSVLFFGLLVAAFGASCSKHTGDAPSDDNKHSSSPTPTPDKVEEEKVPPQIESPLDKNGIRLFPADSGAVDFSYNETKLLGRPRKDLDRALSEIKKYIAENRKEIRFTRVNFSNQWNLDWNGRGEGMITVDVSDQDFDATLTSRITEFESYHNEIGPLYIDVKDKLGVLLTSPAGANQRTKKPPDLEQNVGCRDEATTDRPKYFHLARKQSQTRRSARGGRLSQYRPRGLWRITASDHPENERE